MKKKVYPSLDDIVADVPDGARAHRLDTLDLPVSSSEIRARLAAGDDQVDAPAAVLAYIRERNLYSAPM